MKPISRTELFSLSSGKKKKNALKRCSSFLMIREMQIKMMSYPEAPVIKESIYDKCHEGLQKRKLHCWWEYTLVTCTMENSMEISVK